VIRLSDLRLDNARALLEHDPSSELPAPEASPVVYMQSILDGLCELSLRDPLTGLSNRRHFNHLLNREIESVARSGESVLLMIMDIDHFKKVNDTYGHHAGDLVLQAVSKCLEACVRPMDTVSRFGGEEFAAILPNCPSTFGPVVAERIREAVAALAITVSPNETIHVTISIGGAYAPEWVRSTIELWTERADEQLYRAKSAGRNCVFIEEQRGVAVSADEKGMLFGHLLFGDPASAGVAGDVSDSAVADSEMNRAN
jgi:diguanylate cyclase (GGDEF)-like protein